MAKESKINNHALGIAFGGMALLVSLLGLLLRGIFGGPMMYARGSINPIISLVLILVYVVLGYVAGYALAWMYNRTLKH